MNDSPQKQASVVERILVVDDIFDNSFLLQTLLEDEGYQVDVADSGAVALAKIQANPPNLVLLDVMMPEMNGYEVTRRIRQNPQLPFIPILLITGYEQANSVEAINVGANGFIRKPIDFSDLLLQMRAILTPVGY